MAIDIDRLAERIKESLISYGMLDEEVWNNVLNTIEKTGRYPVDVLLELGVITDRMFGVKMADQWNIVFSSISVDRADHSVKGKVPFEVVKGWNIVPLWQEGDILVIGASDPLVSIGKDFLESEIGMNISFVFLFEENVEEIISEVYKEVSVDFEQDKETVKQFEEREQILSISDLGNISEDADAPIISLIEEMILGAWRQRASDIHIEPFANWVRIRFRIDGVLHEVDRIAKDLHASMVTRIKIMANMDIAEKRLPQDGRILFTKAGNTLDLRVSVLNSSYGETVVIRLLDKSRGLMKLEQLGMDSDMLAVMRRLINLPYGIVLVTGPTGSGKSTTLYAALQEIDFTMRKVVTVEDPVEYQIPGVNQVQVRRIVGLTFASALRAILRQAPDVIMIGEIRDTETAQIAIQSALTGHLVLSTLHTNDAPSAITRLIDMGVPPYLVSSCIAGVLAQRLVRKLCENCRRQAEAISYEERQFLKGDSCDVRFVAGGCPQCRGTGYKGRIGIFELLEADSEIRDYIAKNAPAEELRMLAEARGMKSLRDDGLKKVSLGITTIEEIMRVVG